MLKKNTGRNLTKNIISPTYIEQEVLSDKKKKTTYKVEDPSTIPDPKEFFELGYENPNNIASNGKKHYRRIYYSELENVKELNISSPFIKIPIYRDKFIDSNEFKEVFNQLRSKNKIMRRFNESKEIAPTTSVAENKEGDMRKSLLRKSTVVNETNLTTPCHGYFKGLITCMEEDKRKEFFDNIDIIKEKNPALLKDFTHFTKYNELAKSILVKKNLIARVYILELRDLAKKDLLSESDPYIKIKLGDNEIDEQKNHLDDQANAMIYRKFDIPITLPGASEITIEAWDFDPMFSDELIGATTIDIEDRFYDSNWKDIPHKPIETRKLYHPDLSNVQGSVIMWLELLDQKSNLENSEVDIRLPPVNHMEMRLVVWKTRDIPMMDVEETSDVYIAAFVDPKKSQTTDTHFRCVNGEASFNWRILEKIEYQPKLDHTTLNVQVYDKDIFASDDYICSASLNLKSFLQQIYDLDLPYTFTKSNFKYLPQSDELKKLIEWESETEFWLNCTRTETDGTVNPSGSVLCSLELLPMWKADQVKVGKGRDDPNCNPFLPPPVGRIRFSLNPYVLIGQLVGPRIRDKFVLFVCGILLAVFIASFLPGIIKHLISEAANPFNYVN